MRSVKPVPAPLNPSPLLPAPKISSFAVVVVAEALAAVVPDPVPTAVTSKGLLVSSRRTPEYGCRDTPPPD